MRRKVLARPIKEEKVATDRKYLAQVFSLVNPEVAMGMGVPYSQMMTL